MIEQANWQTWTLIPAGAGWMFAVGIIEQNGRRRVRVAKGRRLSPTAMRMADAGKPPITQQARLNLKPADWEQVRAAIGRYIAQLEQGKQPRESSPAKDNVAPTPREPRTPEQLARDFVREQVIAYMDLESE